jgi:hypothetical protein
MWMEWTVPIQKLEVSKVQTRPIQKTSKPITPLSYVDGPFILQHVNLLLPPLVIKEYDPLTGKLILSLSDSPSTASKLQALQEIILLKVYQQQTTWFNDSNRSKEIIHGLFQPFVEGDTLQLYCPLQTPDKKSFIHIWKEGLWDKLIDPSILTKGSLIRAAIRLQGISFQMNTQTGSWTGRFRVQHRICCLYSCSKLVQPV